MTEPGPPPEVIDLAEQRRAAREQRDFAESDRLRELLGAAGWLVADGPEGYTLAPRPPYPVYASARDVPDRSEAPDEGSCTVSLLVDGWPEDVADCVARVLAHTAATVRILICLNAALPPAPQILTSLVLDHGDRVAGLQLERPAGWGEARQALLRYDTAPVHVLMDPSTLLEGDALSPLLAALQEPGVAGAGWKGVDVSDGWLEFHDAGPGEVEALLGYLFAVRRSAAAQVPVPAKARFYRNADMEWSFLLREAGAGRLVVPQADLPVRQGRHRGYHDTEPELRDRESKRNYDRFLARFRGREELRLPVSPR